MAQARGNIENAVHVAGTARSHVRSGGPLRAFSALLMAVFFVVLMIGLVSGVWMYRSIAKTQARANDLDMEAGIVASAVHVNDVHDSLQKGEGPEGDALVLVDQVGGESYETRIYQYQGKLVQEYTLGGRPYSPQDANELLDVERFSFDVDESLITMDIDGRMINLYVRSSQDGTAVDDDFASETPVSSSASSGSASAGTESIEDETALGGAKGGAR